MEEIRRNHLLNSYLENKSIETQQMPFENSNLKNLVFTFESEISKLKAKICALQDQLKSEEQGLHSVQKEYDQPFQKC